MAAPLDPKIPLDGLEPDLTEDAGAGSQAPAQQIKIKKRSLRVATGETARKTTGEALAESTAMKDAQLAGEQAVGDSDANVK